MMNVCRAERVAQAGRPFCICLEAFEPVFGSINYCKQKADPVVYFKLSRFKIRKGLLVYSIYNSFLLYVIDCMNSTE